MQKPATFIDALDVVRKSRLVTEEQLHACVEEIRASSPLVPPVDELFNSLVKSGLITTFQASQLGHGFWMGFEIGHYRILDRLGQGGMGQVFLAEHLLTGNKVALKVLRRHDATSLIRERFLREARVAAKLRHPNIIRVDDVNPNHDPPYIVMEYADGITLQAAVARAGTFAAGDGAAIGLQVCAALQEAYRNGLVHRDVKPANVLVDRQGVARLLDLGVVRIDGENLTGEYAGKVILGTLDYLSPEQSVDSSNVDIRADIYSLGATLYFVYSGTPPLAAGEIRERLAQLQTVDPPGLQALRPDLPAGLCEVVHRMLAKSPADRQQIPAEAAEELAPFAHASPMFPANLFHQARATVSDSEGMPTPPSGIKPLPELFQAPTAEHSVEIFAPSRKPLISSRVLFAAGSGSKSGWQRFASWRFIVLLAIFGLLAIAFYIFP